MNIKNKLGSKGIHGHIAIGVNFHTNNYAEAEINILKEPVFSRVKAYNLVQMFTFIYDIMDNCHFIHYTNKLLKRILTNLRVTVSAQIS